MAGENLRSKIFSRIVVVFLCLHVSVFFAITWLQFRYTQNLELKLEEKREAVSRLASKCVPDNDRSFEFQTSRVVRALETLAEEDTFYKKLLKHVHTRQASSVTGLVGTLLQQQEHLVAQKCGTDTVICLRGSKGEAGIQGDPGTGGLHGEPGSAGTKGAPGNQGLPGDAGTKGQIGPKGYKGAPGQKGDQGQSGGPGEAGSFGPPGLRGDSGSAGAKGDVGSPGSFGEFGEKGDRGQKGEKGDVGIPGLSGGKGETGDRGLPGLLPVVNTTGCDCLKSPSFTNNASLSSRSKLFGGTQIIDCQVDGKPTPTVTIYKKSPHGCLKNGTSMVGNNTIRLEHFSPVDAGTYTCVAKSSFGTTSKDITLTSPGSMDVINCTFEQQGLCKWRQSDNDDINWTEGTGSTTTVGTGPAFDHTYKAATQGRYMFLKASNSAPSDIARLESLYIPTDGDQCFSLWYNMNGADVNKLAIYSKNCDGQETELWSATGDQGQAWREAKVNIPQDIRGQQIIIEAIRGRGVYGDIAIDDVSIVDQKCPPTDVKPSFLEPNTTIQVQTGQPITINCSVTGKPSPRLEWLKQGACHPQTITSNQAEKLSIASARLSDAGIYKCTASNSVGGAEKFITVNVTDPNPVCNFDDGLLCSWTQSNTDQMDWRHKSGQTPSGDTGPDNDHTKGNSNGKYLFIEASSPASNGDKARLKSELIPANNDICLHMWYNMYGSETGDLNIKIKDCSISNETKIWSRKGNQGNQWLEACSHIPPRPRDYFVIIEAVVGTGFKSDIAIDDLKLTKDNSCHCSIHDHCDFDSDLCDWKQSKTDDFDWTSHSGTTVSSGTGPSSDHTSGRGRYMYTEASSPRQPGDTAELISKSYPGGYNYCLSFWYSMYGSTMGTLSVSVQKQSTKSTIFTKKGDQGQGWHLAKVNIPNPNGSFSIIFSGVRGRGYYSDMAVDDVHVDEGHC